MSDDAAAVLRQVLVSVAEQGATITYGDLLDRFAIAAPDHLVAVRDDLAAVLRAVSVAEDEAGRGLLTAVVVRHLGGLPGGGFFRLAADRGRSVGDDRAAAWRAELERVHAAHRSG